MSNSTLAFELNHAYETDFNFVKFMMSEAIEHERLTGKPLRFVPVGKNLWQKIVENVSSNWLGQTIFQDSYEVFLFPKIVGQRIAMAYKLQALATIYFIVFDSEESTLSLLRVTK